MASPSNSDQEKVASLSNTDQEEHKVIGFSCQLVEPSSPNLQTECPVCLQIIREPHQVTCCGKKFCQSCIQTIKDTNKPCPTCNKQEFNYFPDTGHKQLLYELNVHCSHQREGCQWTGKLKKLDEHLNTDPLPEKALEGCPLTTINCEYHREGCTKRLLRQNMAEHLEEDGGTHMSLLGRHSRQQAHEIDILKSMVVNLENNQSEMAQLRSRVSALEETLKKMKTPPARSTIPVGPYVLTMNNFNRYKESDKIWYSPPVYTHQNGYKICLAVHANGHEQYIGTHVTVCVRFMKGKYDDKLHWPFHGKIYFRLIDQQNQIEHKSDFTNYDYRLQGVRGRRVTATVPTVQGTDIAEQGFSSQLDFIDHRDLEPKYLVNDTLLFQVYKVELKSRD